MARNQKMVYCKHSEEVINVGSCSTCNTERSANQAFKVRVRFKEGYHHGLGEYIGSERELYRKAQEADGTVRWS
jgi:hypothetical protein